MGKFDLSNLLSDGTESTPVASDGHPGPFKPLPDSLPPVARPGEAYVSKGTSLVDVYYVDDDDPDEDDPRDTPSIDGPYTYTVEE